jgi:hypothetical protein
MNKSVAQYKREILADREANNRYVEALYNVVEEEIDYDMKRLKTEHNRACGEPSNPQSLFCRMGIHRFRGRTSKWCFEGWCTRCGIFNRDYSAGWGP